MKRTTIITILVLSAVGLAVILGGVAYRAANAAALASAPQGDGRCGPGWSVSDEYLADALGISVEELNTAYQKANESALKQAVEKGLITQAQADEIKSKGRAFPFGRGWIGWLSQKGIDYQALLAEALGITVEKLQAAYQQAFNARIDQAVADGRLTEEQAELLKGRYALQASPDFKAAMQSAFEAAVKQAVSNGVITQAQADLILKNTPGWGFFGGRGWRCFGEGRGMYGPHRPGGRGAWGWRIP